MTLWQQISAQISQHTQTPFSATEHTRVAGGSINQSYKVSDKVGDKTSHTQQHYFVKLNNASHGNMFEVEAQALQEIAASNTICVPQPICTGHTKDQSWLVMEFLALAHSAPSGASARQLAQQLCAMHKNTAAQFGWHTNNTIGSTPQTNQQHTHWVDFWREQRLQPQLRLAEQNGYGKALSTMGERLLSDFGVLFASHQPVAAMLHGDLWAGNAAALTNGTPIIFDPALYYGDRETDIAMTQLFGGFSPDFYTAYNQAWPLDDGFSVRKTLYNLYHILNHLNLFGESYLSQAVCMSEQILAEI